MPLRSYAETKKERERSKFYTQWTVNGYFIFELHL